MLTLSGYSRRAWLGVAALALLLTPARAQVLDPSFAHVDARATSPNSKGNVVRALATDPAGRVLVGGSFDLLNGQVRGKIGRLLANGQPDPTFGAGGVGANGLIDAIVPLANGKYLVGGTFTRYDGQVAGCVARLNADGSLDATFSTGSGANAMVYTLAVDSQGRVFIGGTFDHFDGHAVPGLACVLPSGAFDASFVPPVPGPEAYVNSVAVDAADRVVVGGDYYSATGNPIVALLERLLPSGAPDPTFGSPVIHPDDYIGRVQVLASGKLLIGGYLYFAGNPASDSQGVRRLNADGSVDATFTLPFTSGGLVRDFEELPTGQLLVAGSGMLLVGRTSSQRVCRLQPDGSPDLTFTPPTISTTVTTVEPGPAGSALVGGSFLTVGGLAQPGLTRLTSSGARDAAFTPPGFQAYSSITALGRQSGDRLVAGGSFEGSAGAASTPVMRFSANGVPDPSFQVDPGLLPSLLSKATPPSIGQGDRVLVADNTHAYRLLPDGARDLSFDDVTGAESSFNSWELDGQLEQPDGRVLVWGRFTKYNQAQRANVVRLTATGAVDASFVPPPDSDFFVNNVALFPNGTMLVQHGTYGRLYWLDASGNPLASFNGGAPLDYAITATALPDNTALVRGSFTLNGTAYQGTYKLTAAGTVDPSFALPAGLSGEVMLVQPDGALIFFESLLLGHRMLRLLPSGAIDPSFTPLEIGTGYYTESAVAWVFQSTGNLVAGGGFTTVDGVQRPTLVRLTNVLTGVADAAASAQAFAVFPNPAHATLTVGRATGESATATLFDVLGRPVRHWQLTAAEQTLPLTGVPAGAYVLRVLSATGVLTRHVAVE